VKSRLSCLLIAFLALGLSGCIVVPAHRHFGPPVVVIKKHDHHGHERGYERHERHYDERGSGPYRR